MSSPSRRLFVVELGAFASFGVFWGAFAVLLADLSEALDLTPGPLGLALFVGATASILTMAALGWTADRLGRRVFLVGSATVFALGVLAVATSTGFVGLLLAVVVLYSGSGLYDVGINAVAVDLERSTGRRQLAVLHAAFSGGAVVGALGSGALLAAGLGFRSAYLVVLAPLLVVTLAVALTAFPTHQDVAPGPGGRRPPLFRNRALVLVALIAMLGLLAEGEMEHWSGVYLRQSLELPALLGASGVAVFYAAMTVGRLAAAVTVHRFGNRLSLVGAGLLTAAGMSLALATLEPAVVVGGFLLVGLALSAVVPIAFSVAGDLAPERAGSAVSVVTTMGYGGFLVGPALIGGLAELTSLRVALAVIVVAGVLVAALATRVGRRSATV